MVVENKVAVITGAGSGIGRETAKQYADYGATVVVADVDDSGGEETVASILDHGGEATFVHTDVSRPTDVREMIETAVEEYGGIDVLFNNAGIEGRLSEFHEYDPEDFEQLVDVNLKGVFLGMKYGIEAMLADGGGSIINTSSVAANAGTPGRGIYSGTKAGVNGMMRTAAVEYAADGIRLNSILPGIVQTPMIERSTATRDSKRLELDTEEAMSGTCHPEHIAKAALFLGSDLSDRITGITVPVDGGLLAKI